jgi:hypothetical protein
VDRKPAADTNRPAAKVFKDDFTNTNTGSSQKHPTNSSATK